jgi:hypothetical protein
MRISHGGLAAAALAVWFTAACGGGNSTAPGGGTSGLTARVNGSAWEATRSRSQPRRWRASLGA